MQSTKSRILFFVKYWEFYGSLLIAAKMLNDIMIYENTRKNILKYKIIHKFCFKKILRINISILKKITFQPLHKRRRIILL